jgi:farnesyl-diphosphate farnesyltransferase
VSSWRRPGRDEALSRALLPKVSRTFALSIEALPAELRRAVRAAYLLCRIVDSIEDAEALDRGLREELFDHFDRSMIDDALDPAPLERAFAAALDDVAGSLSVAERRLCLEAGATLRIFRRLPVAQREAIRPRVLEMSRGMREYAARDRSGRGRISIQDLPDLERYCYFVAGTVGLMLTELFLQRVAVDDPAARRGLQETAVSFGVGLQLVNIAKDVAADASRGGCFLPRDLAREQGLSLARLLEPDQRESGLAVIRRVTHRAREHLRRAQEYTGLWPLPGGEAVRYFCAVPLALALLTLEEVERGDRTLRPGQAPAVSRATVLRIVAEARQAARDPGDLEDFLARCRGGGGSPLYRRRARIQAG